MGKDEKGDPKGTPISCLGLNGAHHILLEGITYAPEKKTAMAQSLGPLTVLIQMLRTKEAKYRKKWEDALKSQLSSIAVIDDIISITRNARTIQEFSSMIHLIAEILLISTSRQIRRMFIPMAMLSEVWGATPDDKKSDLLKRFNVSSHGGYHVYREACNFSWYLPGNMEDSQASQAVFHAIMGTYTEDFGVLEQITDVKRWYTRSELGESFREVQKAGKSAKFKLPQFKYYSKLSSANQNTALAGVYEQVTYAPVFSGWRHHTFSDDFFEHITIPTVKQTTAKNLQLIENSLSETLMELRKLATSHKLDGRWGTVCWYNMETVETNDSKTEQGKVEDLEIRTLNKFFLSKPKK